jgi:uncharacterized damage-inducible protein DinB
MNKEIQYIIKLLQAVYDGTPWYGRNIKEICSEINGTIALRKPNEQQHSIVELLYHMITWREFIISRLQAGNDKTMKYFEENDWRNLDHSDATLWDKGLKLLEDTQMLLVRLLDNQKDELLNQQVAEREYNYRALLHGIIHHDIYHLGQIAYAKKLLK